MVCHYPRAGTGKGVPNTARRWAMAAEKQTVLEACLQELHLPAIRAQYEAVARQAVQESWAYAEYLRELAEREVQQRRHNRIERLLKDSKLPLAKSLESLDLKRLPAKVSQQLRSLVSGDFVDRRENVLVFGPPGTGKTHCLAAVGQELVRSGRRGRAKLISYVRWARSWCGRGTGCCSRRADYWCRNCWWPSGT